MTVRHYHPRDKRTDGRSIPNQAWDPAPRSGDEEFRVPEALQRRSQRLTVVPHISTVLQCELRCHSSSEHSFKSVT